MSNLSADDHRAMAEALLADARRNPVLSGPQSCSAAQVYALLAIEERLARLCTTLDAALGALFDSRRPVAAVGSGMAS